MPPRQRKLWEALRRGLLLMATAIEEYIRSEDVPKPVK